MPRIYKAGEDSITVLGVTYTADQDGIITIPDDGFSQSVYQKGWVPAKGREAQRERRQQADAAIDTVAAAAPAIPVQDASKPSGNKAAPAQSK